MQRPQVDRVTLKVGTRKWEMRNGKQTADILLLQSSRESQCPCTHIFAWQLAPKGYATALHHSLQANSMYKFFTFGSLLAISWNLLNLWIVHTLFQLDTKSYFEASSCTCLHCYGYICLTYSTNSMYYSNLNSNASIFNRSSQNACCSHSSVDTHTGSVENIITVCLHALSGGGNLQQLYTWVRQFCLTK